MSSQSASRLVAALLLPSELIMAISMFERSLRVLNTAIAGLSFSLESYSSIIRSNIDSSLSSAISTSLSSVSYATPSILTFSD